MFTEQEMQLFNAPMSDDELQQYMYSPGFPIEKEQTQKQEVPTYSQELPIKNSSYEECSWQNEASREDSYSTNTSANSMASLHAGYTQPWIGNDDRTNSVFSSGQARCEVNTVPWTDPIETTNLGPSIGYSQSQDIISWPELSGSQATNVAPFDHSSPHTNPALTDPDQCQANNFSWTDHNQLEAGLVPMADNSQFQDRVSWVGPAESQATTVTTTGQFQPEANPALTSQDRCEANKFPWIDPNETETNLAPLTGHSQYQSNSDSRTGLSESQDTNVSSGQFQPAAAPALTGPTLCQGNTFPWMEKTETEDTHVSFDHKRFGRGRFNFSKTLRKMRGIKERSKYTREQKEALEDHFAKRNTISRKENAELAEELNLTKRQVIVWFRNRRAKVVKSSKQDAEIEKLREEAAGKQQEQIEHPPVESRGLDILFQNWNNIQNRFNEVQHQ